ncbi:hypothetical protein ACFL51_00625 [Myxococcota bacterium]
MKRDDHDKAELPALAVIDWTGLSEGEIRLNRVILGLDDPGPPLADPGPADSRPN